MGWRDLFRSSPPAPAPPVAEPPRVVFTAVPQPQLPVDQLLMYLWAKQGAIGRAEALSVPAVRRARNLVCTISTLPLQAVDDNHRVRRRPLFRQLDTNTANVVVLAQTVEDLFFEAIAWWRIVGFDDEGMPSRIRRYDVGDVSLQPPENYEAGLLPSGEATEGVIWMGGQEVPFDQVIRFDSPNPGVLQNGGDAVIRRAIALDRAAGLYASTPRRRGFFKPTEGYDPADDTKIQQILDDWQKASVDRVDGYVPAALDYEAIQDSTPAELQLVQMQQQVAKDLSNMLGIDPEDLAVNTTSRVYQNATDRRQDKINEFLAPYMKAITDRLSMPDVTPEGEHTQFSLNEFLRADPKTRAEVHKIYFDMGATDAAEIRDQERQEPRTITPPGAEVVATSVPRRVPSTLGTEAA